MRSVDGPQAERARLEGAFRWRVLGQQWEANLADLRDDLVPFDLAVFTGDLGDWGHPTDYPQAIAFLKKTCTTLGIPPERLFIVPGNHDVDRTLQHDAWASLRRDISTDPAMCSQWLAGGERGAWSGDARRDQIQERQRAFWSAVTIGLGRPELHPSQSPHGRLGYRQAVTLPGLEQPIHVIGLDTAWLAGDEQDVGKLWLTEHQLSLLTTMGSGAPLPGFRIALMHHRFADLADGSTARTWLADRVDLLLHGHQHDPTTDVLVGPDQQLLVLATGCLYDGDQQHHYPNACQVIDLELDEHARLRHAAVRFRGWSERAYFWGDNSLQYRRARNGRLGLRRGDDGWLFEEAPPVASGMFDLSIVGVAVELVRNEMEKAKTALDAAHHREALEHFDYIVKQTKDIQPRNHALDETLMSGLLGSAAALLNLQELARARQRLAEVDSQLLSGEQRCDMAAMLAQIGEPDRASAILESIEIQVAGEKLLRARQLIQLARGEDPSGEITSALVWSRLAQRAAEAGDLPRGIAAALQAARLAAEHPMIRTSARGALMYVIVACASELHASGALVPRSDLLAALRIVEGPQDDLEALPPVVRSTYLETTFGYAHVLLDHMKIAWLKTKWPEELSALQARQAEASAASASPPPPLDWRDQLRQLHSHFLAKDLQAAAAGLRDVARSAPGHFAVEALLAEVLLATNSAGEALVHAECAYALIPSRGARLLVARCALAARHGDRALQVAIEVDDSDAAFLWVVAQAADAEMSPRAMEHWQSYLRLRPSSAHAELSVAMGHLREGDPATAADLARKLVAERGAHLSAQELIACGQLQIQSKQQAASQEAIRGIAELLGRRFKEDDEAQLARFTLLVAIGERERAGEVDLERLLARGVVRVLTFDDVVSMTRQQAAMASAAHDAYRQGLLTVEALCKTAGAHPASFVIETLEGKRQLRTAVLIGGTRELRRVTGRVLLVSMLELLLLEELGLLKDFPKNLPDTRLVLFKDVWEDVLDQAHSLKFHLDEAEPARLADLASYLASSSRIELLREQLSDEEIASREGTILARAQDPRHNAAWILGILADAGLLSSPELRRLERSWGEGEAPQGTAVPRYLALDFSLLQRVHQAGLLDALTGLFERVIIERQVLDTLTAHRIAAERAAKATGLAAALHSRLGRGLSEGWVELRKRPSPEIRSKLVSDSSKEWLIDTITAALAYKQAMLEDPHLNRVTAEFVGSAAPSPPELWRELPWQSLEEVRAVWKRYRGLKEREWTLVELATTLSDGPATDVLLKLASWGFQDALTADVIVSLVEQYGTLERGRSKELLDQVERALGEPRDEWAAISRSLLAMTYGGAIWRFVRREDASVAVATTRALIARAEQLGRLTDSRFSELVIGGLLLAALSEPHRSVDADGSRVRLKTAGALCDVYDAVHSWTEVQPANLAACRRALSAGWQQLAARHPEGPPGIYCLPMGLATDHMLRGGSFERPPGPDAVVAILSALWEERPLLHRGLQEPRVDLEALLQHAARLLGEKDAEQCAVTFEDISVASFPLPSPHEDMRALAPIEAILLRSDPGPRGQAARELAAEVGSLDGRLYCALAALSRDPTSREALAGVAKAAVDAPFRWVADDPALIRSWGERSTIGHHGYPATLVELRELLSEPPIIDPSKIGDEIDIRANGGAWSERTDAADLMVGAGRAPGPHTVRIARVLATRAVDDLWAVAQTILRDPSGTPIGRLAQAVALIACGPSSRDPRITSEEAAAALEGMFGELGKDPPSSIASEHEQCALLEQIVIRLSRQAGMQRSTPKNEVLWLTLRLYEWWCQVADFDSRNAVVAARPEPDRDWHRARRDVILNVLLDVVEISVVLDEPSPAHLQPLVPVLLDYSNREPWDASPLAGLWHRPHGGGWLAASLALLLDAARFFDLADALRVRILEALPTEKDEVEHLASVYVPFVDAVIVGADRLCDEELRLFSAWLEGLEASEIGFHWKTLGWATLITLGRTDLHARLWDLVRDGLGGDGRQALLQRYLMAVSSHNAAVEVRESACGSIARELAANPERVALFEEAWKGMDLEEIRTRIGQLLQAVVKELAESDHARVAHALEAVLRAR